MLNFRRQWIKFGETDLGSENDNAAVEEREITKVSIHPDFNRNDHDNYL